MNLSVFPTGCLYSLRRHFHADTFILAEEKHEAELFCSHLGFSMKQLIPAASALCCKLFHKLEGFAAKKPQLALSGFELFAFHVLPVFDIHGVLALLRGVMPCGSHLAARCGGMEHSDRHFTEKRQSSLNLETWNKWGGPPQAGANVYAAKVPDLPAGLGLYFLFSRVVQARVCANATAPKPIKQCPAGTLLFLVLSGLSRPKATDIGLSTGAALFAPGRQTKCLAEALASGAEPFLLRMKPCDLFLVARLRIAGLSHRTASSVRGGCEFTAGPFQVLSGGFKGGKPGAFAGLPPLTIFSAGLA